MTPQELREVLTYDPDSGIFTWVRTRSRFALAGTQAGSILRCGHRQITIGQKGYKAHRLAWLWVYGVIPDSEIDHVNEVPDDNRIENLRLLTHKGNARNKSNPRSDNKSGFRGVSFDKDRDKWRAAIVVDGRQIHLGRFDTPEKAHNAYIAAKREHHPEWVEK